MPIDTPQQIDLSQDIKGQDIKKLSPEQQESFQSYLDGLKEEEKQGIIYLTGQELHSLRQKLDAQKVLQDDNAIFRAAGEENLRTFVDEQKAEGISLEDMIGDFENTPEALRANLESLEKVADKVLFGNEGMFQNLDISDTAKDHISMSLIMSFSTHGMEQLMQEMQEEDFDSSQIVERFTEISEGLKGTFGTLKSVIDETQTSDEGDVPYVSIVDVNERGEGNKIFMEINSGKEFFDEIIEGNITKSNIEQTIEDANLEEGEAIDNNLESVIGEFMQTSSEMQDAIQSLSVEDQDALVKAMQDSGVTIDENGEAVGDNSEELTGFAKIIHDILKALTEGLKGFADAFDFDNDQDDNTPDDSPETEEIAPTNVELGRRLMREKLTEGNIEPFTLTQVQELFPESGELNEQAIAIIRIIENIGEGNTPEGFEREFDNFFSLEGERTHTKFQLFVEASPNILINTDESLGINLFRVLEKYKEYRDGGTNEAFTTWFESN